MGLGARLNLQDKECLCVLKVCFGKHPHPGGREPGKGQPCPWGRSCQRVWAWQGECPLQQQVGWE